MCDTNLWDGPGPDIEVVLAKRDNNMARNSRPWHLRALNLLLLPEKATRKILNYAFADDGRHRIEERGCHCISDTHPDKTIPFRQGPTAYMVDSCTGCDVVRAESACPLDLKHGALRLWCLKQYLAHNPGKKRKIPALAVTCKRLYKDWRDVTVWVFCTEICLARELRLLPYGNTKLMTHIRLFERSNEMNLPDEKEQWAPRREAYLDGSGRAVHYEVGENQEIEYKGAKVFVKEMKMQMVDYDV